MSENMNGKGTDWRTPEEVFKPLNDEFHFTLDAAATKESTKCTKYYTPETDGLSASWEGETVFCNPPAQDLGEWVCKCAKEGQKPGTTVVLLVPAKTDAAYFHDYIADQSEIRFLKGRMIMTDGSGNSSGRPACGSLLAIYRGPAVKRTEGTGAMSSNAGDTRRESYNTIETKRAARRGLILEILGNRQLTASELTEDLLAKGYIKYYDRNFVAPRLTELKEAGVITTVGKRMCSRTGKNVAIWARKEQRHDPE
ncbi:MAG: DNA N-6-adenine-methyltransferase [Candidatus Dehalobacter alkaniphilus]|jgi:phage N-6-adenine-methyltransferase